MVVIPCSHGGLSPDATEVPKRLTDGGTPARAPARKSLSVLASLPSDPTHAGWRAALSSPASQPSLPSSRRQSLRGRAALGEQGRPFDFDFARSSIFQDSPNSWRGCAASERVWLCFLSLLLPSIPRHLDKPPPRYFFFLLPFIPSFLPPPSPLAHIVFMRRA